MRAPFLAAVALLAAVWPAAAQRPIDQTVATAATGVVAVTNTAGSVRVSGWDREEIRVTGTLGEGAERLAISGDGGRTEIRVVLPRDGRRRNVHGSDLEIRLPRGKALAVNTTSADIAVSGVNGALTLRSTSGEVEVAGSPGEVTAGSTSGDIVFRGGTTARVRASTTSGDVRVAGTVREHVNAESVSGDVEVTATTPEVRATAISGDVSLRGVSGRVSANTVSGNAVIRESRVQYGSFESVSGSLLFEGDLQRGAAFSISSHSGEIELRLPANVSSDFEIHTFSGDIVNELGPRAQRTGRYTPARELRFTAGSGGGLVTLKTFSGAVRLLRR